MKKICSVVGARPQFIKLAVVLRELRKNFYYMTCHRQENTDTDGKLDAILSAINEFFNNNFSNKEVL